LIQSTDWEKVDRICQAQLKRSGQTIFPNQDVEVSPTHLQILLSKVNKVATFPVYRLEELDHDEKAIHFKDKRALQAAEELQEAPQLIWNRTKYGMEFLRLNSSKTDYVPQQYFVYPERVKDIQKETGHQNASLKLSGFSGEIQENMGGY
jgi:hypothetical protein